jgi:hypothetical protein
MIMDTSNVVCMVKMLKIGQSAGKDIKIVRNKVSRQDYVSPSTTTGLLVIGN